MARRLVVGGLRVQQINQRDGRRSWTILGPEGTEHPEADRFLRRHEGSGTQRTYAYVLVDHLRWLERECLTLDRVVLRDLERYMGILGAEVRMPLGEPWRVDKRPYGRAALSITAGYAHSDLAGEFRESDGLERSHLLMAGLHELGIMVGTLPSRQQAVDAITGITKNLAYPHSRSRASRTSPTVSDTSSDLSSAISHAAGACSASAVKRNERCVISGCARR